MPILEMQSAALSGFPRDCAAIVSMPMMALSGVRISWDMRERKFDFAALACSAWTSALRAAIPAGTSGAVPLLWSCPLNPDKLSSCAVAQDRSEK